MKRHRLGSAMGLLVLVGMGPMALAEYSFTQVDPPGGNGNLWLTSISGQTVLGYYTGVNSVSHGFAWNGGVFTLVDHLPRDSGQSMYVGGMSGDTIVGFYGIPNQYWYQSFTYRSDVWTDFAVPTSAGAYVTWAYGISGDTIYGSYAFDVSTWRAWGFTMSGDTFTSVQIGYTSTVNGVSGNTIVGTYSDAAGWHGFKKIDDTIVALDAPGTAGETWVNGTDGDSIVGCYYDSANLRHGFVLENGVYTTVDYPGAKQTSITAIEGAKIAGYFVDAAGTHGFVGTLQAVPEPTSLGVVALGAAGLLARRRRR